MQALSAKDLDDLSFSFEGELMDLASEAEGVLNKAFKAKLEAIITDYRDRGLPQKEIDSYFAMQPLPFAVH